MNFRFSYLRFAFYVIFSISFTVTNATSATVELKITGAEEIVVNHNRDSCETWDIPDQPARAFRDKLDRVQLIASHYITRREIGQEKLDPKLNPNLNLNHVKHDCALLKDLPPHYNPDPAKFDDHKWLSSFYSADGDTVYALIHNEFHGWQHPYQCGSQKSFDCWYNGITLAISKNRGDFYDYPPKNFVAAAPYRYKINTGPVGIFGPSNILHNEQDGYYYVFFKSLKAYQKLPGNSIGLMRTKDLADASSWRVWNGKNFTVRFINPYEEINEKPENHIYTPLSPQSLRDMSASSVTYNTFLKKYLMIGTGHVKDSNSGQVVWGIAYSFSEDLIHWSPSQLLKQIVQPGAFKVGDSDPIAYPSALDPNSSSRNFETTGKNFYLYYTRFNYNRLKKPNWTADRDLLRVSVEIDAITEKKPTSVVTHSPRSQP